MKAMTILAPSSPASRPERLFTVEEYFRMVEVGILTKNDKVELIEGRIVEKMPGNPAHEAALQRIHELLLRACASDWMVRVEAPLKLKGSAPEPDAMVIRGPINRYDRQHPQSTDALLVVEVSDTTLRADRQDKIPMYAGAAIPVYWIVNLTERRVERYYNPTGPEELPTYKSRDDFSESDSISLEFPDGTMANFRVADMLPGKDS
jgi:Uma2 family endonuclease